MEIVIDCSLIDNSKSKEHKEKQWYFNNKFHIENDGVCVYSNHKIATIFHEWKKVIFQIFNDFHPRLVWKIATKSKNMKNREKKFSAINDDLEKCTKILNELHFHVVPQNNNRNFTRIKSACSNNEIVKYISDKQQDIFEMKFDIGNANIFQMSINNNCGREDAERIFFIIEVQSSKSIKITPILIDWNHHILYTKIKRGKLLGSEWLLKIK